MLIINSHWALRIRRGLRKPPKVLAARLLSEAKMMLQRWHIPWLARRFNQQSLLAGSDFATIDDLWAAIASRDYVIPTDNINPDMLNNICPQEQERVIAGATRACAHEVNLLGSGWVQLGEKINWHCDYPSGKCYPRSYGRGIDYNNLDERSDVKFVWELSRLQWLIPVAQAYLLTKDERYAQYAREILLAWINDNPYGYGVNWACTMEVALRIISWSYLFKVFNSSNAWSQQAFREKFCCSLYLHAHFTLRYLEKAEINGNHYTANAAGLVFAGLFFKPLPAAAQWLTAGQAILDNEIMLQVTADGVDYEASIAYHRLVLELFLLPALYRMQLGYDVPKQYQQRLILMAQFVAAYTQPDGSSPLIGDADDGRALPLGGQQLNDHRYLLAVVGHVWRNEELLAAFSGSNSELCWLLGLPVAAALAATVARVAPKSMAFTDAGFYIMRNDCDHIIIDCGPIGLAGRGGHGHNDCLSFEAVLSGQKLITDCGAYVYTRDYQERNNFRSTAYHNTPQIDSQENNRFIAATELWTMHYDAKPTVTQWQVGAKYDRFVGGHSGYQRLPQPVQLQRTIELAHAEHSLSIQDKFIGNGEHHVRVPLHLAAGVVATVSTPGVVMLTTNTGKVYQLLWSSDSDNWQLEIIPGRLSPSYGVLQAIEVLVWQSTGPLRNLCLSIRPCHG